LIEGELLGQRFGDKERPPPATGPEDDVTSGTRRVDPEAADPAVFAHTVGETAREPTIREPPEH